MLSSLLIMLSLSTGSISLLPLGDVDPAQLETIGREVAERFAVAAGTQPAQAIPGGSFDPERGQYSSALILDWLGAEPPTHDTIQLAVVGEDLYAAGLDFVLGQADPGTRAAVISLARLDEQFHGRRPNRRLLLDRAVKEAVHELGHVYGLNHCLQSGCVMFSSSSLADTDRKSSHLCAECRKLMPVRRR